MARDLRRRYGASYRIVRAESGESALGALRELKLRGDLVAVILADYRMPQMNGIEFLEQALDVYPGARRVLLTAYADTNAAIDAINVVDLDHYLLKPWDPPEEKLYPVLDDLLRAWRAGDHRPVPSRRSSGTAGRRAPRTSGSSWPATRCRTAGTPPTSRRDGGCWPRPVRTGCGCRW
ncbi:response regulator [Streptomyces coeruleorubidus]|uniref:response regulator n=1 Tax=Streptomyces coeruleorubidus TaxID=116188 RepID=UPI003CD001E1